MSSNQPPRVEANTNYNMLEMRAINGVLSTMVGYHTHIHILIQTLSVYEVGSNVKPF